MVERSVGLGNVHGFAAHFHHECLSNRDERCRPGHCEAGAVQALQVHGHAGKRHGGVNRQTDSAQRGRRCENLGAVTAGGVHQNLTGGNTSRGRQVGDKARQLVIGNRENQQFATLSNLLHRQ